MIRVVCFDLGGVLVKIRPSWRLALSHIPGAPASLPDDLESFEPFKEYQAGGIQEGEYLAALSQWARLHSRESAVRAHQAILIEPYPKTWELVRGLQKAGYKSGCLSNTNGLHWDLMMDFSEYPAVASLDFKSASHISKKAKPDVGAYLHFESLCAHAPGQILFFDDNLSNVIAARDRGWAAEQVDPSIETAPQIVRYLRSHGIDLDL